MNLLEFHARVISLTGGDKKFRHKEDAKFKLTLELVVFRLDLDEASTKIHY